MSVPTMSDAPERLRLLSDAMHKLPLACAAGIDVDAAPLRALVHGSLLLEPHIGYHRAAQIVNFAHAHGQSLRSASLALGILSPEQFDAWIHAGPRF